MVNIRKKNVEFKILVGLAILRRNYYMHHNAGAEIEWNLPNRSEGIQESYMIVNIRQTSTKIQFFGRVAYFTPEPLVFDTDTDAEIGGESPSNSDVKLQIRPKFWIHRTFLRLFTIE